MEFAVWEGFWARQAVQSVMQVLMAGQKDGNSSAIPERFAGESLEAFQVAEQGSF